VGDKSRQRNRNSSDIFAAHGDSLWQAEPCAPAEHLNARVFAFLELPVNNGQLESAGQDRSTQFVELLTAHQRKLYGYISVMLLGSPAAADVLQETNLDLWSKIGEYDFEKPFLPWAFGFARQKVLVHRRSHGRSRLVISEEAMRLIDTISVEYAMEADERLVALRSCLQRLTTEQAELLRERYVMKAPVKIIAERLDETVHNISSRLHRIRKNLANCINARLRAEGR
jgi:RNA polymerase sigma-70 factor, ECF subfamily